MQGFVEVEIGVTPYRTQFLENNTQAKRGKYGLKHHVTIVIHTNTGDTLQSMENEISLGNGNYKMWDKGQIIVILSQTKLAKNNFIVGDENYTIAAMKYLLTRKTQWYEYMEEMIRIININYGEEALPSRIVMNQSTYKYCIFDISLPQLNTGYVYMLVSIKNLNFTYIGKTMYIQNIIQQHNSCFVSVST